MFRFLAFATVSAILSGTAFAADLAVTVTTPDGKPVANAVVTLPAPAGAAKPAFPWKLEVRQEDRKFAPYVLVAPVGAEVAFPNLDRFRHHVYSFSKGNKFELPLYSRGEKRSATMKTAGTVALGCNIHDEMVAFVRVVDTPFAALTDETGVAVLRGVPGAAGALTVWHPHAKGKDQTATAQLAAGASRASVTISVTAHAGH